VSAAVLFKLESGIFGRLASSSDCVLCSCCCGGFVITSPSTVSVTVVCSSGYHSAGCGTKTVFVTVVCPLERLGAGWVRKIGPAIEDNLSIAITEGVDVNIAIHKKTECITSLLCNIIKLQCLYIFFVGWISNRIWLNTI